MEDAGMTDSEVCLKSDDDKISKKFSACRGVKKLPIRQDRQLRNDAGR